MTRRIPLMRRLHVHFFPPRTRAAWHLLSVSVFTNVVASAMPLDGMRLVYRSGETRELDSGGSSSGSISANVWVPIMVVTIALVVLMFLMCLKRSMSRALATARRDSATDDSTQPATAADQNVSSNRRRRPRRTPSQISTKSLPPYMKEPGDHELVIYRGPLDMEDQPPNPVLPLARVEEDPEPSMIPFNISLDRVGSRDTLPDGSTAHLVRSVTPGSVDLRSLESSLQSHSTNSELLVSHQRTRSRDSDIDLRGEAPPYSEEAVMHGDPSTLPLPQPSLPPDLGISVPQPVHDTPGDRRSRFGFLRYPFSSHTHTTSTANHSRTAALATHARGGSVHTLVSSEYTAASRPTTPNDASRSSLLALRGIRTRASSAGSAALSSPSMISLHSISAPLQHTLTRTEFRIPRGGLTAEQVKIITARDAPERFGRPYGPAAVAFAGSRVLATSDAADTPPPEFDEAVGAISGDSGVDATAVLDRGELEEAGAGASLALTSSPTSLAPTTTSSHHNSLTSEQQQSAELHVDTHATSSVQPFRTPDLDEAMTPPTARPLSITPAAQGSVVS
ncbi:hypothetical protein EDC04DRAFT_2893000 [Pisolithus marmoratus]|nr:hypothetical protein EDC04DRAFT_2893000 [Pisolithus marmoratus]